VRTEKRKAMSATVRTMNYLLSGSLLALTAALITEGALRLPLVFGWLICINVFTFVFYGVDKLNSIWEDEKAENKALKARIPEAALLLLALAGGSPAAALAIALLPHKTAKDWFLIRFLFIVIIQGIALYFLWDMLPWPGTSAAS
jgi:uncharacterized membrane protein YsdA (DUF1294 family)